MLIIHIEQMMQLSQMHMQQLILCCLLSFLHDAWVSTSSVAIYFCVILLSSSLFLSAYFLPNSKLDKAKALYKKHYGLVKKRVRRPANTGGKSSNTGATVTLYGEKTPGSRVFATIAGYRRDYFGYFSVDWNTCVKLDCCRNVRRLFLSLFIYYGRVDVALLP